MARYSGGPVTHRALTGPSDAAMRGNEHTRKSHLLYTLNCILEVRGKIDRTELETVRKARQEGISWTEIGTALGVSRQAVWEHWRELDEEIAVGSQAPR